MKRWYLFCFMLGVISYWFLPKDYNAETITQNTPVASPSAIVGIQTDGNGQCVTYRFNNGLQKVECK